MNIAVESKIPFIRGVFESVGHSVDYLDPEEFTRDMVKDADALVVRTRTRCDATLLEGTRVRVIATATIGTDHIDLDYCKQHEISVRNAPGCNAPGVAQYVLASIAALGYDRDAVIGIVGVGHVGSIVNRWADVNGFKALLCDPPLGLPATLGELAEKADIITFHTPLDATTRHMVDASFLAACKRRPAIINAARGPVVKTSALTEALRNNRVCAAVIDCWEGEPDIDLRLLDMATIATPHIAGYSLEGKQRATAMAVSAIENSISLHIPPVSEAPTLDAICQSYDPMIDTLALKNNPKDFELLRNTYDYRREP